MVDIGLVSASLGVSLTDLDRGEDLVMANEGAIAEQAVGQALRVVEPPFHEPKLHSWARDTPGSEAEVDYVIQQGTHIVPVEVKAGATGGLRSLHVLMAARAWKRAVRFNADRPSVTQVSTSTSGAIAPPTSWCRCRCIWQQTSVGFSTIRNRVRASGSLPTAGGVE